MPDPAELNLNNTQSTSTPGDVPSPEVHKSPLLQPHHPYKNKWVVLLILFIALTIPMVVYLAQQSQELRQRAQQAYCTELGGCLAPGGSCCGGFVEGFDASCPVTETRCVAECIPDNQCKPAGGFCCNAEDFTTPNEPGCAPTGQICRPRCIQPGQCTAPGRICCDGSTPVFVGFSECPVTEEKCPAPGTGSPPPRASPTPAPQPSPSQPPPPPPSTPPGGGPECNVFMVGGNRTVQVGELFSVAWNNTSGLTAINSTASTNPAGILQPPVSVITGALPACPPNASGDCVFGNLSFTQAGALTIVITVQNDIGSNTCQLTVQAEAPCNKYCRNTTVTTSPTQLPMCGESGYTVTMTGDIQLCGEPATLTFPTWSQTNGQDDISWYAPTQTGPNTWQQTINSANHPGNNGELIFTDVWITNPNIYCGGATMLRQCVPPSPTPTPAPTPAPFCADIRIYSVTGDANNPANWTRLNQAQMNALQPGDTVYISIVGSSQNAPVQFSRGRIRVNMGTTVGAFSETTNVKPKASATDLDEFYITYQIPPTLGATTTFGPQGEVCVLSGSTCTWY